jgi:hypothetical protein
MKSLLARLGHWLVLRCDPPKAPIRDRFRLVFEEGGDARRAIEALQSVKMLGHFEFQQDGQCRGRYPEEIN